MLKSIITILNIKKMHTGNTVIKPYQPAEVMHLEEKVVENN